MKTKKYKYFGDLQNTYKLWDKAFIKRVAKFGIPMGIASIVMGLMAVIDKIFIGQAGSLDGSIGDYALGATFIASWYYSLVVMTIMGFTSMAGVVGAQYFGASKYKETEQVLRLSLTVGICFAIIGVILAQVIPTQITSLLGQTHGHDIAAQANAKYGPSYLRIMSFSALFFVLTRHITLIYSWNEKTRIVLYATVGALGLNALFDYVFMFELNLGVVGCAWSTVMVEGAMLLFLFIHLGTRKDYKGTFNPFKNLNNMSIKMNKQVMRQGSMFLNQILFTTLMTVGQIFMARAFTEGPTIQGIVNPFENFFLIAMAGVLSTNKVIVGKDLGVKEYERAYANSMRIAVYAIVIALIGMVLFMATSPGLPYLFSAGRNDANIRNQATIVICITSATYVIWIWAQGYGIPLRVGGKGFQFIFASAGSAFIDFIVALILFLTMPSIDFWLAFLIWKSTRITRVMVAYSFYRTQGWVRTLVRH